MVYGYTVGGNDGHVVAKYDVYARSPTIRGYLWVSIARQTNALEHKCQ